MPATKRAASRRRQPWWVDLDYEELLDVRLCDLQLTIEGTAIEKRLKQLHRELERAGLRFRPHTWLSTGWFTPDGVTGFAVPFYLAHPRLTRIEHSVMFEAEGGNHAWCMKLLRHEAGHAIDNAYRLHWRKDWRKAFGAFSHPYAPTYRPRPGSRSFVLNLDYWYAQSHPAEDWAECFAVWLRPQSRWQKDYAGWPAMRKLKYVDRAMAEIGKLPARVRCRRTPDSLARQRITLREYHQQKQDWYGHQYPSASDTYLERLFSSDEAYSHRPTAASFLQRHRQELRSRVSAVTGQYRYVVDQALKDTIASCKRLGLRLTRPERDTRSDAAILLTTLAMNFLHGGRKEFHR